MNQGTRADAVAKAQGTALYVGDMEPPEGTLHLATIRSSIGHGAVVDVDLSEALRMPGVVAAYWAGQPGPIDSAWRLAEYVQSGFTHLMAAEPQLLARQVRFEGDLIAVVLAEESDQARLAARQATVSYQPLGLVRNFEEALVPGQIAVHGEASDNVACHDSLEWGDVESAMARADVVVKHEFDGASAIHSSMEGPLPFIVDCIGTTKTIEAPVANPWMVARHIASALDVPVDDVAVQVPMIGGHFGSKQATSALVVGAIASQHLSRPVRHVPTSREVYRTSGRHAGRFTIQVAANKEGLLMAGDARIILETGAYFTGAAVVLHNSIIASWGAYKWPNFRASGESVFTNTVPYGPFRGTGKNLTTFGIESAIDSIAKELGIHPVRFRAMNCLKRGDRIAEEWLVRGSPCRVSAPPIDCDMPEMLEQAWTWLEDGEPTSDEPIEPSLTNSQGTRWARGQGIALSFRHGSQHSGPAEVRLRVRGDRVLAEHNAAEIGGGQHNVIASVCAASLGVPVEDVLVAAPDTTNRLKFSGVNAQRTSVQIGMATHRACESLMHDLVARLNERSTEASASGSSHWTWSTEAGLRSGDRRWGLWELRETLNGLPELEGEGRHVLDMGERDAAFGEMDGWTPGVGVADVEVDVLTGEVRVLRYGAIAEAGKMLHVSSARGQVAGGVVMGLGVALKEGVRYVDGILETDNPFDYAIPRMSDIPENLGVVVRETGGGSGPFGSRPVAQTSLPCVTPAIANAIRAATGAHVAAMPITAEHVLEATEAASSIAAVTQGGATHAV